MSSLGPTYTVEKGCTPGSTMAVVGSSTRPSAASSTPLGGGVGSRHNDVSVGRPPLLGYWSFGGFAAAMSTSRVCQISKAGVPNALASSSRGASHKR